MLRRPVTIVLAGLYLLQATWLLQAGMDSILPTARAVAAAHSGGCCTSDCGCPEDAKARRDCCCARHEALRIAHRPAPGSAPSALEEARCKGIEDALTQAVSQPTLSGFAVLDVPPTRAFRSTPSESEPQFSPSCIGIDKVPIAPA